MVKGFISLVFLGILFTGAAAYGPPLSVYLTRESNHLEIYDCYPAAAPDGYMTITLSIEGDQAFYNCDLADSFEIYPPDVPPPPIYDYYKYTITTWSY